MTTFQDVSWLVQVALFCASLLVVLAWLVQFSLALLRPRWCARVQGKRETPWQLPLSLTHQTLTGGVWGSLLRLRLGRDGAGSDTEAGVKGLLSSLFAFKSFREHWQRAWVRALNEQACRQGVSKLILSWYSNICRRFSIYIRMCFHCCMHVYTFVRVFLGCASVCGHNIMAWLLVSECVGVRVSGDAGSCVTTTHSLSSRNLLCSYDRPQSTVSSGPLSHGTKFALFFFLVNQCKWEYFLMGKMQKMWYPCCLCAWDVVYI